MMRGFFIKWFINTLALLAVVHIIPGIRVDRLETVLIAALVLGLVNIFFKPIIILFTLPINILSLGFFTLVINALLFYLVSKMVSGYSITGFWAAFWGALAFSIVSFMLNLFISPRGNIRTQFYSYDQRGRSKDYNVIDVEADKDADDTAS